MFDSDYTNAVEWFNAAEIEADDNLKIEIQSYRNNIANEILDSVQINRSQMTIAYAEKLTLISLELMPGNKRANEILANLYLDRGLLNTDIGNFTPQPGGKNKLGLNVELIEYDSVFWPKPNLSCNK